MKKLILIILILIIVIIFFSIKANNEKKQINKTSKSEFINQETKKVEELQSKTEKIIEKTESNNEEVDAVNNIIKNYNYLDSPSTEQGKILFNNIRLLKAKPELTFLIISKTLKRLTSAQENSKQFLIQLTANLEIDKKQKLNFLEKQLFLSLENLNNENEQSYFTPSIIIDTYTKTSNDYKKIENLLLRAIPKAPQIIQRRLINSYSQFNKERAKLLFSEY